MSARAGLFCNLSLSQPAVGRRSPEVAERPRRAEHEPSSRQRTGQDWTVQAPPAVPRLPPDEVLCQLGVPEVEDPPEVARDEAMYQARQACALQKTAAECDAAAFSEDLIREKRPSSDADQAPCLDGGNMTVKARSKLLEVEPIDELSPVHEPRPCYAEECSVPLLVRQAFSGAKLAKVRVRPSDTIAEVSEAVLKQAQEVGVAVQLLFESKVLDLRLTVREAGLTSVDNPDVTAVLTPLRCLTSSMDGTARIRHLQSGVQLLVDLGCRVWASAIAPGSSTLVMVSTNGKGTLWCAETGVHLVTLSERIHSCSFSPDGLYFAGATDDCGARIWCSETGKCLQTLSGHADDVKAAAFSPDGALVVTASSDGSSCIFEACSGTRLQTLRGHSDVVMSACFSPDGRLVLTASMDCTARLWAVDTGSCIRTFSGHSKAVSIASFSKTGGRVLTSSFDGSVRVWCSDSGECSLTVPGYNGVVTSATFAPDASRILVVSGSEQIHMFDSATGELCVTMAGHEDWVKMASFSPDGMLVVSSSYDGTARIWSALTGECLQKLAGHSGTVVCAELIVG